MARHIKFPLSKIMDFWFFIGNSLISHYHNPSSPPITPLMTNFLTGVQQFLSDLGGGEYYHVSIKGKGIYGFKCEGQHLSEGYLVIETELIPEKKSREFFRHFSAKMMENLSPEQFEGKNNHKMLEAVFQRTLKDIGLLK